MKLVCFSGASGSGKSTACSGLAAIHDGNTSLVKLAQPLYDMQEYIYNRILPTYRRPKSFKKDRKLLQWLGTEWGRDTISPDLWIYMFLDKIEKLNKIHDEDHELLVVCDDVRFDNEAEAIHSIGGVIVFIENPNPKNASRGMENHATDAGIDPSKVDHTLKNVGTAEDFEKEIISLYEKIFGCSVIIEQRQIEARKDRINNMIEGKSK